MMGALKKYLLTTHQQYHVANKTHGHTNKYLEQVRRLTIQHRDDRLSQRQHQTQWGAEQEEVRHLKVKLAQGASI